MTCYVYLHYPLNDSYFYNRSVIKSSDTSPVQDTTYSKFNSLSVNNPIRRMSTLIVDRISPYGSRSSLATSIKTPTIDEAQVPHGPKQDNNSDADPKKKHNVTVAYKDQHVTQYVHNSEEGSHGSPNGCSTCLPCTA